MRILTTIFYEAKKIDPDLVFRSSKGLYKWRDNCITETSGKVEWSDRSTGVISCFVWKNVYTQMVGKVNMPSTVEPL